MNPHDPICWTALITPLLNDGSIDWESLEHLVRRQEQAGNGILLLGSTGEALALDLSEQRLIVETVCNLTLNVPLMIGVGGFQLSKQLEWIQYCEQLPIHSYLLNTPLYAKPGPIGQIHWFESLLNASSRKCMLYNIPSRAGIDLHPAVLEALHAHENCWSVKDASGHSDSLIAYQNAAEGDIEIFSGEDALMPELAACGAKGLVSVMANIWPEATRDYVACALQGKAQHIAAEWKSIAAAGFTVSNPIPTKAYLAKQGIISTATCRAPLSANELRDDCAQLIKADALVTKTQ